MHAQKKTPLEIIAFYQLVAVGCLLRKKTKKSWINTNDFL